MKKISAILVNFHCAAETLAAVDSILSENGDCALYIVDNSTDRSEADLLASSLPHTARLIVSERNLGFGAACNRAFQDDAASYVLLLNPDAQLLPGAFRRLTDTLDDNPRLAAVAPATWWDEEQQWLLPTLLPETARQWFISALANRWPKRIGQRAAASWLAWQRRLHAGSGPQAVAFLSGAILLLRRSAVEMAGGLFDPRFFMFYEDADLSRRLRSAGFNLALLPEANAVHHWRNKASKAGLMAENAARYVNKYYPALALSAEYLGQPIGAPLALLGQPPEIPGYWGIGRCASPPLASAADWKCWLDNSRLLCISPTPQGVPAAFRPSGTAALEATKELWDRLDSGHYVALGEFEGHLRWLAFEKSP